LRRRPFAHAVTELVLRMARERNWCWSTVASALSACAAFALEQLTIYTTERTNIELRKDPYFAQAMSHVQRQARITAGTSSLSVGMTRQKYDVLTGSAGLKSPAPRLLLQLCWHFAARVGDMRQG